IANSLFDDEVVFNAVTPAFAGSGTWPKPSKYVTTPGVDVIVTFPVLLGRTPNTTGASLPKLYDDLPVVRLRGAPDLQLKMPDNCQFSTNRATIAGAFPSRA